MADALTPVDFHGTPLYVTQVEGRPYVAIKPICDALTVNWPAQYRRIQRHAVLSQGVAVTTTPSKGGMQETLLLPLDLLNGWLFGISAARVRNPECRTRLVQYQAECFAVLAAHFGATTSDSAQGFSYRQAMTMQVEKLALRPEQQKLVNGKAYELAAESFEIILDHVERCVASRVPGNQRANPDTRLVQQVLSGITLDGAMVHRHTQNLRMLENLAGCFLNIAQDTVSAMKRERLGAAAENHPAELGVQP